MSKYRKKYLKDYKRPGFAIEKVELEFDLDKDKTWVHSRLYFKGNRNRELLLNGSGFLHLEEIKLSGKDPLYELTEDNDIVIKGAPEEFVLETKLWMSPSENTACEGLYICDGIFTTQCEAEGFRNITYYPDRPDVLSTFKVTIRADGKRYNAYLSNGNKVSERDLKDGRKEVVWEDPSLKPCYLFAIVVGNLGHLEDSFTTMSGRKVELHLYCDKGKEDKLTYAMECLKKSMKWDEERFGREYDLDIFNIVAVSSFVFGAMENKSLNIFNDVALLADKDVSTDALYTNILDTIGHEYFHNWSGNRVTLSNWFELALKEGLTVYREQEFSRDMTSRTMGRIRNIGNLKFAQYPEDNGPLAHPIRAREYVSINNFYTMTVYEKGAEVIRMLERIIGWDAFRKGCDLYFARFDGQAVGIMDFIDCHQEVSGKDMTQFKRWYDHVGRPCVEVEKKLQGGRFILKLRQTQGGEPIELVIPLSVGLLDKSGKEIAANMLVLDKAEQEFVFDGIMEEPVISMNRDFTAPVDIGLSRTPDERRIIMQNDTDLFNRYDAGQQYALEQIVAGRCDDTFVEALGSYLDIKGDNEFVASSIILPSIVEITNAVEKIDYDSLLIARKNINKAFACRYKDRLQDIYKNLDTGKLYSIEKQDIADRSLKNTVLGYLALTDEGADFAYVQYKKADNLTDRMAALYALHVSDMDRADKAMADFYERFQNNHLAVLKWFSLWSRADRPDVLSKVRELVKHPAFDYKVPNKVYTVIRNFAYNPEYFHAKDGSGYEFLADNIIIMDKMNPTVASGIAESFKDMDRLDDVRKAKMREQAERIAATKMTPNLSEIIGKVLGETYD